MEKTDKKKGGCMKKMLLILSLFYFIISTNGRHLQVSTYYQWEDWLIAQSLNDPNTTYYIPLWTVTLIQERK
jgi:hypothetical protein